VTHAEQVERLATLLDPDTPTAVRSRPVKANVPMHHKLLELVEPASEITGAFTALVSDYGVDRQGERFARHAFDNAIARVAAQRRATPVLYGHDQQSVEAIIGFVPPNGWTANDKGLIARGQLDMDMIGGRIYRMLQKGALAWSVGFTITRETPARGNEPGVLEEVGELYELSAVPIPANDRTRTISLKDDEPRPPSRTELERRLREALGHVVRIAPDDLAETEDDALLAALKRRRNGHEDDVGKAMPPTAVKAGPIQVAVFPVA
jgi:HK97 family phage prohead protease